MYPLPTFAASTSDKKVRFDVTQQGWPNNLDDLKATKFAGTSRAETVFAAADSVPIQTSTGATATSVSYDTSRRRVSVGTVNTDRWTGRSFLEQRRAPTSGPARWAKKTNTNELFPSAPRVEPPLIEYSYAAVQRLVERTEPEAFNDASNVPELEIFRPRNKSIYPPDSDCLELADSSLTNREFWYIGVPGHKGWFLDNHINVSLDLLSEVMNCENNDIAILTCFYARSCYQIRTIEGIEWEGKNYSDLKQKILGKDWVIMPINDGIDIVRDDGHVVAAGSHWSVVVVDCRAKDRMRALYIDSLCQVDDSGSKSQKIAKRCVLGLRRLLAEQGRIYPIAPKWAVDKNAPNQGYRADNKCSRDGSSACGPFVWAITKEIVQFIVDCKEDGADIGTWGFSLPGGFKERFEWDSQETRLAIQRLIACKRRMQNVRDLEWHKRTGRIGKRSAG